MLDLIKRKNVDLLVDQLWKYGYLTLKRKYGTYLSAPEKVGGFDIDIVSRQKKDYAIGVSLSVEEINNPKLLEKISFLATRHTKFTNNNVTLFLGVPSSHLKKVKELVEVLGDDIKKNIKFVSIPETGVPSPTEKRRKKDTSKSLFA
jgi:hypothetical protein